MRLGILGAVAVVLSLSACNERQVPPSEYQEVGYGDFLSLTSEEVHHALPAWRFEGQCGDFYCFSEVFIPFHPEPGDLRRWIRPRRVKVRTNSIRFTDTYLRNIGQESIEFGTVSERFCSHDLKP